MGPLAGALRLSGALGLSGEVHVDGEEAGHQGWEHMAPALASSSVLCGWCPCLPLCTKGPGGSLDLPFPMWEQEPQGAVLARSPRPRLAEE